MTNLTALREQLDQVLAEAAADLDAQAAARAAALDDRERVIAQAVEAVAEDAVRAAWHEAQRHEQARVLSLIDAQIDALRGTSGGAVVVLRTLKRMVVA